MEEAPAADGSAAAGELAGLGEAAGGAVEALGVLDAATGGLATPFIALGAVVGVGAVAAVETFKVGLHVATDEVKLFGLKISSAIDDLAAFSPALAMAQANSEVRSILDDMREAQEVGPDLARLAEAQSEAQHQMREIWLPIKKVVTEIMASVMELLADWLKDARVLFSIEFWEETMKLFVEMLKAGMTAGLAGDIRGEWDKIKALVKAIKENTDKEEKPDVQMWMRDLYNTRFDEEPSASWQRGRDFDRRPNVPLVNPLPGM